MTVEDYGVAPMAEEGVRFLIPSLGEDAGGRVMRYESEAAAEEAATFYKELGTQSAVLFSWAFQNGPLVVQINGELPEEQARQYEEALGSLSP
ncbi:MAG: hypothetical protein H6637_05135 [Ardenticatenales bacterium]|nr:hypothetical protein [Ardenticatenales bacterium]